MAESDCGVACHRKINIVGRKTLGCLTAPHNSIMFSFELSRKLGPAKICPLAGLSTRCSFTRTATADVISGSNAVTPKTNLRNYYKKEWFL